MDRNDTDMRTDTLAKYRSTDAFAPFLPRSGAADTRVSARAPHGFEVYVAAGQVWVSMAGWTECRALYPDHARALAYAIERVATRGEDGEVVLAQNTSLAVGVDGELVTLVCADRAGKPEGVGLAVDRMTAYDFARTICDAADRAVRSCLRHSG